MNITVFCEDSSYMANVEHVNKVYPKGLGRGIADVFGKDTKLILQKDGEDASALLSILDDTDVLVWWGHTLHSSVSDDVVTEVCNRVLRGMGLIALHSAHVSKVFKKLMGTSCTLKWREDDTNERLWCVNPNHPICRGVDEHVDLAKEEMYGEFFDIPTPDELVYIGWFKGGEVFRAGCVFNRGNGKVFYFNPGHETYPTYKNASIRKIMKNAAKYVCPQNGIRPPFTCPNTQPLEKY